MDELYILRDSSVRGVYEGRNVKVVIQLPLLENVNWSNENIMDLLKWINGNLELRGLNRPLGYKFEQSFKEDINITTLFLIFSGMMDAKKFEMFLVKKKKFFFNNQFFDIDGSRLSITITIL
jgi:hypothetical protein